MKLVARVREQFGVALPAVTLYESPTVAGVAGRLEQERGKQGASTQEPIAQRLRTAFPTERPTLMTEYLRHHLAQRLRIPLKQLPVDASFKGQDPHTLAHDLRRDFGFEFHPHELRAHPSLPECPGSAACRSTLHGSLNPPDRRDVE
ncbi:acyl carrier protein [Corallococcus sp. bb12-1]|uniref:acyl carrier protein n=1 Tax=Corallococcus sp. bb12-1 TaxID=2996784 RepID=UPI00226D5F71|nr:acyl carrier protein [Corallococcus sp. bb12-1]MCY1043717.1 acyl carrier protein [Corallococcus sp. bb12-1]